MAAAAPLLCGLLLLTSASLLVTGSPCPDLWRQSGAWCYLANSTSSLSWAGATAFCLEHGGELATIKDRSKLLDVVDLLKGLAAPGAPPRPAGLRLSSRTRRPPSRLVVDPALQAYSSRPEYLTDIDSPLPLGSTGRRVTSWWIGIQKTSGSVSVAERGGPFDNYGEEKISRDASDVHLCVYLSTDDGFWYWSACDNALNYICQREADRVDVALVTPDRRRTDAAWFAMYGAAIEAALYDRARNSAQDDDKGTFVPERATTTAATAATQPPSASPPSPPPGTAAATCAGSNWVAAVGRCHKLFLESKNWSMAEAFCVQQGGHLSSLASSDDQQAFRRTYNFSEGSLWFGLSRGAPGGAFRWSDGAAVGFSVWAPGQPGTAGDCGLFDMHTGQWSVGDCSTPRVFACSRSPDATTAPTVATVAPSVAPPACGDDNWMKHNGVCITVVTDSPASWHQAELNCRSRSATLAKVDSHLVHILITLEARQNGRRSVWIGLNKLAPPHVPRWTDGSAMSPVLISRSSATDMASCFRIHQNGRQSSIGPANCNAPLDYACQKPADGSAPPPPPPSPPPLRSSCPSAWAPYGDGRCLRVYPERTSWADARRACRDEATDAELVSVADPVQQAFLTLAIKNSTGNLWIGLTHATLDNLHFLTWTDESAVNFTAWAPGQPSSVCAGCPVPCGMVSGGQSQTPGVWSDVDCTQRFSFVCQRPATPNNSISAGPKFCDPPFGDYIAAGDSCYKITQLEMTWSDAANYCQTENSSLAYVGDVFDNAQLVTLLYRDGGAQYWLGLSDTLHYGTMEWTQPWPPSPTFLNWDPVGQQPAVRSSCAVLVAASGLWRHVSCTARRPFVCQRSLRPPPAAPGGARCPADGPWVGGATRCFRVFQGGDDSLGWAAAKDACEQRGYQLAVVSSEEDFGAIRDATQNLTQQQGSSAWIGLKHQDSGPAWVDGSPVTVAMWSGQEPQPSSPERGCVKASRQAGGRWVTEQCSTRLPFVCMTVADRPVTGAAAGGGGGGGWAVFGIVCLVLVLVVALVGLGLWLAGRRRLFGWLPRRLAAHNSVENLAYHHRDEAISSDWPNRANLENGGLDGAAANRWGSQEQLVVNEDL